jgi:hypothetical protein
MEEKETKMAAVSPTAEEIHTTALFCDVRVKL